MRSTADDSLVRFLEAERDLAGAVAAPRLPAGDDYNPSDEDSRQPSTTAGADPGVVPASLAVPPAVPAGGR